VLRTEQSAAYRLHATGKKSRVEKIGIMDQTEELSKVKWRGLDFTLLLNFTLKGVTLIMAIHSVNSAD
jgi:hypothetical protein